MAADFRHGHGRVTGVTGITPALGFWGTTAILMLPPVAGTAGRWLAVQVVAFGLVYPWLAGLDDQRELLYLNLCAALFVVAAAWQLARRFQSRG